MRLDGVIFDLDGTLLDSSPDVFNAANYVLQRRNMSTSLVAVRAALASGSAEWMRDLLKSMGMALSEEEYQEIRKEFLQYYRLHPMVDSEVFAGVETCLQKLKSLGVKLAVCTNKPSKLTALVLKQAGLAEYFEVVVAADDVVAKKPDPLHLHETIKRLGTEKVVMIGDSRADILAADAAGVPSLLFCENDSKSLDNTYIEMTQGVFFCYSALLFKLEELMG